MGSLDRLALLTCAGLVAFLSGCANPGEAELRKTLGHEGIVSFSPPQGSTRNPIDWSKYGPGAILDRHGNVSRGVFYASAKTATHDPDVITLAMDPAQHSAMSFPSPITLERGRNGEFGVTSLASEAAMLSAKLGASNVTKVEIDLGKVEKSAPYSLTAMRDFKAAYEAKHGPVPSGYAFNLYPVFTDSLSYSFYTRSTDGQEVKLTVPTSAGASFKDVGYAVRSGSLQKTGPTFLGYYPF